MNALACRRSLFLRPKLSGSSGIGFRGSEYGQIRGICLLQKHVQPVRRFFSQQKTTAENSSPTFWQRFLAAKPMPERKTAAWYREMALICTVFAITGSSTMMLVRPAVGDILGIRGSFRDGPWSYRICSVIIMTPLYATLLVMVGTVFGRHAYFRHFSVKIFSRFGIPPEVMDPTFHATKKTFRKW